MTEAERTGVSTVLDLDVGALQYIGTRESQQDSFRMRELGDGPDRETLLIVADGMGGHVGGALASRLASDGFADAYHTDTTSNVPQRLRDALDAANEAIATRIAEDDDVDGMGTTLLAASIVRGQCHWASVGDSPAWLYRAGNLMQLNADHSMVPILRRMVENGELTEEEAARDPRRNSLRSALSGDDIALVDIPDTPLALQHGDTLLLASDGVESLSVPELERLLALELEATDTCAAIMTAVEDLGKRSQDNATLIVCKVLDGRMPDPVEHTRSETNEDTAQTAKRSFPWLFVAGAVAALALVGFLAFTGGDSAEESAMDAEPAGVPKGSAAVDADGTAGAASSNDKDNRELKSPRPDEEPATTDDLDSSQDSKDPPAGDEPDLNKQKKAQDSSGGEEGDEAAQEGTDDQGEADDGAAAGDDEDEPDAT